MDRERRGPGGGYMPSARAGEVRDEWEAGTVEASSAEEAVSLATRASKTLSLLGEPGKLHQGREGLFSVSFGDVAKLVVREGKHPEREMKELADKSFGQRGA